MPPTHRRQTPPRAVAGVVTCRRTNCQVETATDEEGCLMTAAPRFDQVDDLLDEAELEVPIPRRRRHDSAWGMMLMGRSGGCLFVGRRFRLGSRGQGDIVRSPLNRCRTRQRPSQPPPETGADWVPRGRSLPPRESTPAPPPCRGSLITLVDPLGGGSNRCRPLPGVRRLLSSSAPVPLRRCFRLPPTRLGGWRDVSGRGSKRRNLFNCPTKSWRATAPPRRPGPGAVTCRRTTAKSNGDAGGRCSTVAARSAGHRPVGGLDGIDRVVEDLRCRCRGGGRIHWFQGEPEALEGWLAHLAVADVLPPPSKVLYVDFETTIVASPPGYSRSAPSRTRITAHRFIYLRPDEPLYDRHGSPYLETSTSGSDLTAHNPDPGRDRRRYRSDGQPKGSTRSTTSTSPNGCDSSPGRLAQSPVQPCLHRPRHQEKREQGPLRHRRATQARRPHRSRLQGEQQQGGSPGHQRPRHRHSIAPSRKTGPGGSAPRPSDGPHRRPRITAYPDGGVTAKLLHPTRSAPRHRVRYGNASSNYSTPTTAPPRHRSNPMSKARPTSHGWEQRWLLRRWLAAPSRRGGRGALTWSVPRRGANSSPAVADGMFVQFHGGSPSASGLEASG